MLRTRECAPIPCFSVVFYLGLTFESLKELGTRHEMFEDMDRLKYCAFVIAVVATNSFDMFNANELEEGVGHLMYSSVGVRNALATM